VNAPAPRGPAGDAARARLPSKTIFALKVVVSVALLAFLFSRIPAAEVVGLMTRARPGLVLLAIALFTASIAGSAVQWGLFLRAQGVTLPFGTLLQFYLVGLFFNNFLPATLGGDVVKVIDVHRAGGTRAAAVVATLMDRAMGLLVLVAAALAALWLAGDALPLPELRAPLVAASVLLAAVFAAILSRRALGLCAAAAARVPGRRPRDLAARLVEHVGRFQRDRRVFLVAFALSVGIQAIRIGVHYLAALALGVTVSPILFLIVVPVIAVAVTLPLSVGGWGMREGVAVLLFGRLGVGAPQTLAFELLAHLVTVLVSASGGVLFALRKRRA
jgi:uncharacterized protein (TIRG00374 family)